MSHIVALLNVTDAAKLFGVTPRTILRKIKDGSISDTQVMRQGRDTKIYMNELCRVFGEPKKATNKENQGDIVSHDNTRHVTKHVTDDPQNVAYSDPRDKTIAVLERELAREREQNEARLAESLEREREQKERADRYEQEAAEQRHVAESLRQKLLEPPKPRGFLARMLGR